MDTTDLNPAPRNSYAGTFESLIEATNTFKNYRAILLTGATFLSAAGVAGLLQQWLAAWEVRLLPDEGRY